MSGKDRGGGNRVLGHVLLETERLNIRSFTPDDINDLHRQLSDPQVMRFYPAVHSREDTEKWLQGILKDYETNGCGMLALQLKATGEFIGQAGVMRRVVYGAEVYYLSYLLLKEFWRQGYASEAVRRILDNAFDVLQVPKVIALIRPENRSSIRLAERLGLIFESAAQHAGFEQYVYTLSRQATDAPA